MKKLHRTYQASRRPSPSPVSFLHFLDSRITLLEGARRLGTARNYRSARKSLLLYLDGRPLMITDIDARFADDYYDWLLARGMTRNSASFHMRVLRAVYNKAVKKGHAEQQFPFRDVYTGVDKTRKRAVDTGIIRGLLTLDLGDDEALTLTRDLFMFSIYTCGMAFVDMTFLRRDDVADNRIIYHRRKTGQRLSVALEGETREIITRYAERRPDSEFVFPIITAASQKERYEEYQRALGAYNYRLRRLSKMLGLRRGLSSYTARHTWATMAMNLDVPIAVISAGMGHTSERTTRIYLESLETGKVDGANRRILDSLQLKA